jgi:hypothetical protein
MLPPSSRGRSRRRARRRPPWSALQRGASGAGPRVTARPPHRVPVFELPLAAAAAVDARIGAPNGPSIICLTASHVTIRGSIPRARDARFPPPPRLRPPPPTPATRSAGRAANSAKADYGVQPSPFSRCPASRSAQITANTLAGHVKLCQFQIPIAFSCEADEPPPTEDAARPSRRCCRASARPSSAPRSPKFGPVTRTDELHAHTQHGCATPCAGRDLLGKRSDAPIRWWPGRPPPVDPSS